MRETNTEEQDALIREVDEELKNESLKKMWDKYGFYIILLVVVALTAAVSFETMKAWYTKKIQTWSDTYTHALSLQNQGQYEDSLDIYNYIIQKDYGVFVDLSKIQKTHILLQQNKIDEALNLMAEISQDEEFNPHMRQVMTLKLASFKLENAPIEEIEKLIGAMAQDKNNSFAPIAQEMLALANLRDGNTEEAHRIYDNLLQSSQLTEGDKARIKNILSALDKFDTASASATENNAHSEETAK